MTELIRGMGKLLNRLEDPWVGFARCHLTANRLDPGIDWSTRNSGQFLPPIVGKWAYSAYSVDPPIGDRNPLGWPLMLFAEDGTMVGQLFYVEHFERIKGAPLPAYHPDATLEPRDYYVMIGRCDWPLEPWSR